MLLRTAIIAAIFVATQLIAVLSQNVPLFSVTNNAQQASLQPQFSVNISPPFATETTRPITGGPINPNPNPPFNQMSESSKQISQGAEQFALELFTKLSDIVTENKYNRDFMISPFAIWALLMLLTEGAAGKSLYELQNALHIDGNQQILRHAFRDVQDFLKVNTSTIQVASLQALFTDKNQPVNRDFEITIERIYRADLIPVDFHDVNKTYHEINEYASNATRGLIPSTVLPQDLESANLFLLSSLFFKGQWKYPFNRSLTRLESFYNEAGEPIANVEMMVQEANFRYAGLNELEGHVLELPYGKQNRLSMYIILPRKGVSLNKVINNVKNIGLKAILSSTAKAPSIYDDDEEVEVYLPKFTSETDLAMTKVLQELGIYDIFSANDANLSKIANGVFVSNIIHSTKIIVDEEGTQAAAVASAVLANKATPPKFYLNRPFIYLIMEKTTNLLLFAGQLSNPKK